MLSILTALVFASGRASRPPYRPNPSQVEASYLRADAVSRDAREKVRMLVLLPNWLDGGKAFWYRKDGPKGKGEFIKVDSATGNKTPAFDSVRLAGALSKELGQTVDPDHLPFRAIRYVNGALRFDTDSSGWELDSTTYALKKVDRAPRPPGRRRDAFNQDLRPPSGEPRTSPDGKWIARIDGNNVLVKPSGGAETAFTTDGTDDAYYARLQWSADSKRLIAIRVHRGDRKKVYLIQSSPAVWGPCTTENQVQYDRPGDVVDTFDIS